MGRKKSSILNSITSILGRLIQLSVSIVSRKVIIDVLGVQYLGISGFFANILFIFSIAEMGFSYALIQAMYKPMAEADNVKLEQLTAYFKRIYMIVVAVMTAAAIVCYPLLPYLIADDKAINDLGIIFVLFFSSYIIPYLVAHRKSLIVVAQKEYLVNIYITVLNILQIISQICVIYFLHDYLIFVTVQVVFTLILNGVIYIKAQKLFPFLRNKQHPILGEDEKKSIFGNAKALFVNNMSGIVLSGTDNILISSFLGLTWVGIYTNYTSITSALKALIHNAYSSMTASIGDLVNKASLQEVEIFYGRFMFFAHSIISICGLCCLCLFDDFIRITYGNEFVASQLILILIIADLFIFCLRIPTLIVRNVYGIFRQDMYKGVFECIINLAVSIVMLKYYGLAGVLMGTVCSTLFVSLWIEPFMLYKHAFKTSPIVYWREQIYPILKDILIYVSGYFLFEKFVIDSFEMIIIKAILVALFGIVCLIITNCKNDNLRYFLGLVFYKKR